MCLVWVRTVLCETNSARAISGPVSSLFEQPEHLQLAIAQRFGRMSVGWPGAGRPSSRSRGVVTGDAVLRGVAQQASIGAPSSRKSRT